jgi:DNA-directed RNA polymerase specialized sigma24 family protein
MRDTERDVLSGLSVAALATRLTDRQRQAVALLALGFTQGEVAALLGVCRPAITRRLQRARHRTAARR